MDTSKIYEEKVKAKAKEFVEEHLGPEAKLLMKPDEYEEAVIEFMNVFLAGANCARQVLLELVELKKKQ